ncbi:hypothetical protein EI94DRAFT_1677401 [Lactarius quietus]|nr:hypothetical protein EI94DRAFT_1677401 [Lactarius quietus]
MNLESSPKKAPKHKGKGKENTDSEFRSVRASVVLAVPPIFANRLRDGVEEMLDTMTMRYEPTLNGVVLAHSNVRFLEHVARLQGDSPFAICHVEFEALVWSPQRGMSLYGRVTLASPDHVSLLVHRTFNVSIPRHHIPADQWEFEYGPAENDPEFGGGDDRMDVDTITGVHEDDEQATDQRGRWVHKVTGDRLGGKDRWLRFTVVGFTVANQMLSLVGSIQPDPFSPEHVPQAKPGRVRSPQPDSNTHPVPDPNESGENDDEELDAPAWSGQSGDDTVRNAKGRHNKQRVRQGSKRRRSTSAIEKTPRRPSPKQNEKRRRSRTDETVVSVVSG